MADVRSPKFEARRMMEALGIAPRIFYYVLGI
jgi:hypothetical protein